MNNFTNKLFLTFAIVSGFLMSCGESPPPLLIASDYDVQKIQVLHLCHGQNHYEPLFSIEDKQIIEQIILFLKENNHSWQYPFGGTAPILPYKLNIYSNNKIALVIWYGNNTLMGRSLKKNVGAVREKGLSNKKIANFVNSIGTKSKCE